MSESVYVLTVRQDESSLVRVFHTLKGVQDYVEGGVRKDYRDEYPEGLGADEEDSMEQEIAAMRKSLESSHCWEAFNGVYYDLDIRRYEDEAEADPFAGIRKVVVSFPVDYAGRVKWTERELSSGRIVFCHGDWSFIVSAREDGSNLNVVAGVYHIDETFRIEAYGQTVGDAVLSLTDKMDWNK